MPNDKTNRRERKRMIVAMTGATGAIYGFRLLEILRAMDEWETHLIMSPAAVLNIREELPQGKGALEALADVVHNVRNIGASIASGSFLCEGMIVAPCSMRTLGTVALALSDNLISRAADVMLKERRRLVMITRETPLHLAHLRNMVACTEMGAIIFPPVPAFYSRPASLEDVVEHSCMRVLDLFGIHVHAEKRWKGLSKETASLVNTPAHLEGT